MCLACPWSGEEAGSGGLSEQEAERRETRHVAGMGVVGGDRSWGFLATVRPFLQNLRLWGIIAESSAEDEYD